MPNRRLPTALSRAVAASVLLLLVACGQHGGPREPREDTEATTSSAATPQEAGEDVGTLPGVPSVPRARRQLATLAVAQPRSMDGYRRDIFPHWSSRGDGCDTRERVLARDGEEVRRDEECRAVAGTWRSPYDGRTLRDDSEVEIDHVVPLAEAWRSGAADWSETRREAFANDLRRPQLLAVSVTANRAKNDSRPDEWLPPVRSYRCVYGRAWIAVKAHYGLSVTQAERRALTATLARCPG